MAESEHSEESPQPEASIVNIVLSWKEKTAFFMIEICPLEEEVVNRRVRRL